MVAAAREAQQQLAQVRDAPTGELRVSAPVGFARHVAQALAGLLNAHPGVTLRLQVDDQLIDLIEERIDLALRFGQLGDSSWVARKLCEFERLVCAAPAYLRLQDPTQRLIVGSPVFSSAVDGFSMIHTWPGSAGSQVRASR